MHSPVGRRTRRAAGDRLRKRNGTRDTGSRTDAGSGAGNGRRRGTGENNRKIPEKNPENPLTFRGACYYGRINKDLRKRTIKDKQMLAFFVPFSP